MGLHKSVVLINRINRFFGTDLKAVTKPFDTANLHILPDNGKANIYITCVDTVAARYDIATALDSLEDYGSEDRSKPLYWMDLGNSKNTGQVILSTIGFIKQPKSKLYRTVAYIRSC